uniref:Proteasome activator PA28 C-terminal domain-containing protein n=1 Tax=Trichuris muris TaxID=70415 RepID=A0A5S6QMA5_TRIMR
MSLHRSDLVTAELTSDVDPESIENNEQGASCEMQQDKLVRPANVNSVLNKEEKMFPSIMPKESQCSQPLNQTLITLSKTANPECNLRNEHHAGVTQNLPRESGKHRSPDIPRENIEINDLMKTNEEDIVKVESCFEKWSRSIKLPPRNYFIAQSYVEIGEHNFSQNPFVYCLHGLVNSEVMIFPEMFYRAVDLLRNFRLALNGHIKYGSALWVMEDRLNASVVEVDGIRSQMEEYYAKRLQLLRQYCKRTHVVDWICAVYQLDAYQYHDCCCNLRIMQGHYVLMYETLVRESRRKKTDDDKAIDIKIELSINAQRRGGKPVAAIAAVNEQPKAKLRSKTLCTSKCTAADIENNVSSFDGQGNTISRLSEDKICIGNLKQDREFAQEKKSVPVEDSERIKCVPTNPHIETLHEILRKQLAKFSRSLELGFEWIDVHLSCSQFDRKESLAAAEHFERIFLNWRCTADQIVDDLLSYYHDRGVTIGEHINCPQIVDFIAAAHEMDVTQYRSVLFHLHRIRNFYVLGSELVFLHLNRFGLTEQEELIQNYCQLE